MHDIMGGFDFMHGHAMDSETSSKHICFDDVSDILIVGADTDWCACAQITLFQYKKIFNI